MTRQIVRLVEGAEDEERMQESCIEIARRLDELAPGSNATIFNINVTINILGSLIVHCTGDPLDALEDVIRALRETVFDNFGQGGTA